MHHLRALTGAVVAAILAMAAFTAPSFAVESRPFDASFHGTFTITFGTGTGGTDELRFKGPGHATLLGPSQVKGYAQLAHDPARPGCSDIVFDKTTITSENGEQLSIENRAKDCMETTPDGRTLIHGNGTYTITGGTGRLTGATGTGTVSTEAIVTGSIPGGVTGSFDPLTFHGTIARRR